MIFAALAFLSMYAITFPLAIYFGYRSTEPKDAA